MDGLTDLVLGKGASNRADTSRLGKGSLRGGVCQARHDRPAAPAGCCAAVGSAVSELPRCWLLAPASNSPPGRRVPGQRAAART